jgi:Ca2+-binding RTX toxin-like protein
LTLGSGGGALLGEAGNDVLNGGRGSDALMGGADDDSLNGGAGQDVLIGGAGADSFNGGTGIDVLYVDAADLSANIIGGADYDVAIADGPAGVSFTWNDTNGIEQFIGGIGNDSVDASGMTTAFYGYGGDGNDTLTLGSGGGALFGEAGNDILNGGPGSDLLNGGAGDDSLNGGGDQDVLIGGAGADSFNGSGGIDILYVDAADLSANIVGGADYDVAIADGTAGVSFIWNDANGIEQFIGGTGNDSVNVGGVTTAFYGYGGDGNDTLTLGSGGGALFGEAGDDTLSLSAGGGALHGGDGDDILLGGNGDNHYTGGAGADTFHLGQGAGANFVLDFNHGEGDLLDLAGTGVTGFADLQFSAATADNWIMMTAGSTVSWVHSATALDASDFRF